MACSFSGDKEEVPLPCTDVCVVLILLLINTALCPFLVLLSFSVFVWFMRGFLLICEQVCLVYVDGDEGNTIFNTAKMRGWGWKI